MAQILLFARGVVALLDLWPALTIAVREQWGGSDSSDKKIWMASVLVDEFESRAIYLDTAGSTPKVKSASVTIPVASGEARLDPRSASEPPLDQDQVHDLISQMMTDEFDAMIEDDSIPRLASDIVRLWVDIVTLPTSISKSMPTSGSTEAPQERADMVVKTSEELVLALERKAKSVGGKVVAQKGADVEIVDDDGEVWMSDDNDDDDDEEDQEVENDAGERMDEDEIPQLVESKEPIVDDEGFTLVQKGRRR